MNRAPRLGPEDAHGDTAEPEGDHEAWDTAVGDEGKNDEIEHTLPMRTTKCSKLCVSTVHLGCT